MANIFKESKINRPQDCELELRFKYTGNISLPNFLRLAICLVKYSVLTVIFY